MKHSRTAEFSAAAREVAPSPDAPRWSDRAPDPNAARVVAARARTLNRAWRSPIPDRTAFLVDRCRGREVLDVGCVAHDIDRMADPQWLHARIASVARRCLGVDVLAEGVLEMRRLGFDAVAHDLSQGLGAIADRAPFDVIIAGEVIEHLESIGMLFRAAAEALRPDGELIVTTPNPYAPHRVRAGQRGVVWENVDHVLYAFPSGVAELAERHGLRLEEAAVTRPRGMTLGEVVRWARSRARGSGWITVGFTSVGSLRERRVDVGLVRRFFSVGWSRRRPFVGETFVYVVTRPRA